MRRSPPAGLPFSRNSAWLLAIVVLLVPQVGWAAPMSDAAFRQILLLLSVVGVGYIVTHLVVERLSRRFGFGRNSEYILLGVVLGPALGIIDPEIARDIRPILSLGAGALGMLAGLELRISTPYARRGAWVAAAAVVTMTGLFVAVLPLGTLALLGYDIGSDQAWTGALIAAAVVVLGSDGGVVRSMTAFMGARGSAPVVGATVAQLTQTIAVLGFGILFAVLSSGDDLALRPPVEAAKALGLQIGSGLILGFLAIVIVHRQLEDRVLLTVLVGLVFLGGGFAYAMNVSAIFVNFVTGVVIGRLCRHHLQITRMMQNIKQPFVISLYFFAGLEWVAGTTWLFLLVPVFMVLRRLGRRLGGWMASRTFKPALDVGPATIAPGGLAVAFMLTLRLAYPDVPGMRDIYGPLLIGIMAIEFAAPRLVRKWLLDVADVPAEARRRNVDFPTTTEA